MVLIFTREHELEKKEGETGRGRSIYKWGNLWGEKFRQHESTVFQEKGETVDVTDG